MQTETLLSVNGLDIKKGGIYKITNKPDKSAPDGFQREGTTKLPSEGIGNTVSCRYVITNKSSKTGLYDTGFYVGSPCYANMPKEERTRLVSVLQKAIVEPYEAKYGAGILSHKNEEFWDNFGIYLTKGRVLNTEQVDDLMDLYIAMRAYKLTPKTKVGDPRFKGSQYCVEDKELVKSIQNERAEGLMDAITSFGILSKTDKTNLINILKYVGLVRVDTKVDVETLKPAFFQWLEKSHTNVSNFHKTYEMLNSEEGVEILNLYVRLNELFRKGVLDKEGGEFAFKGEKIGGDLKTASNNLVKIPDFDELKMQLLEVE